MIQSKDKEFQEREIKRSGQCSAGSRGQQRAHRRQQSRAEEQQEAAESSRQVGRNQQQRGEHKVQGPRLY